jgi:hypothetical protein
MVCLVLFINMDARGDLVIWWGRIPLLQRLSSDLPALWVFGVVGITLCIC